MDIVVPQISEVVSDIVLVRWLKAEGDAVRKGEPLFELDTDKYVVEIEAFADGTLAELVVPAGSVVEAGQVVARFQGEGAAPTGHPPPLGEHPRPSGFAPVEAVDARGGRRVLASPKARRLAQEFGVDIAALVGTGNEGLVTSADVEAAAGLIGQMQTADSGVEPLSAARRAIALRMQTSKRDVPHFYVMVDADMSESVRLRQHCAETLGGPPPTFTDLMVTACARALRRCPEANVKLEGDGLRSSTSTGVGIAVGHESGLVVPVIEDADRLDLRSLSTRVRESVERARSGRLLQSDLAERSMVLSNLGMHGIDVFLAIVDLPDPMILAAGRVAERCVVADGAPAVRWQCTLALSADHRVLDGVLAARYLGLVQHELEHALAFLPEEG